MNNNIIGTKFEKYVQRLLMQCGTRASHNIMYHKGKRACQVDLEYTTGVFFRERTVLECKYVQPGSSLHFARAYAQLGEVLLFTGFSNGIIVTNSNIPDLESKEREYRIRIYDRDVLLALRFGKKGSAASNLDRLDEEIRRMHVSGSETEFIHRYL